MKKKSKKSNKKTRNAERDADSVGSSDESSTKPARARVDYEEFVRLWTRSSTISEVAEQLDIKTTSATSIATRLRKMGIPLKKFARRNMSAVDVKALTRIVKEG